jgi:hypothetical protein
MNFKNILAILIIFLHVVNSFGQRDKKYDSDEEKEYYKTLSGEDFVPLCLVDILNFNCPQINIKEIQNFTKFKSIDYSPPNQDLLSIEELDLINFQKQQTFEDIPLFNIIKMDTTDSKGYIIFVSYEYSEFNFNDGGEYWIAVKNKYGWRKYYTGLSENLPLHLKSDSKLNLIKNDNTLQIESALLRKIDSSGYSDPESGPAYEIVKDGIVTEFLIDSLIIDSDNDELTDIEERKMMLNPFSNDTDNDGINDYSDLNPRFQRKANDTSLLYDYLLSKLNYMRNSDTLIKFEKYTDMNYFEKGFPTYLIITDNQDLQSVYPDDSRFIIMTPNEYEKHCNEYPLSFSRIYVTPLFKVNKLKNTYKLKVSFCSGGVYFLIIRTKDGWKIKDTIVYNV